MPSKAMLSLLGATAAMVLGTAGCSGSTTANTGSSSPSSAPTSAAALEATAEPGAKVSANTASESEIESALSAAGVNNAGRWAEEVVEYRPYPADDPDLTKLRDNLAKYNPGQETVDKIVSALTP